MAMEEWQDYSKLLFWGSPIKFFIIFQAKTISKIISKIIMPLLVSLISRGKSNAFVSFMLKMIDLSLEELIRNTSIYSNNSIYEKRLLDVMPCEIYLSANEIMDLLGLKSKEMLRKNYLDPLIKSKTIVLEFPNKLTSKNQRYKRVK